MLVPVAAVRGVAVAVVNEVGVVAVLELLMATALAVRVLVRGMHGVGLAAALVPVSGMFGV